eukprot:362746-Chlamydomonas_euryale.AAC.1
MVWRLCAWTVVVVGFGRWRPTLWSVLAGGCWDESSGGCDLRVWRVSAKSQAFRDAVVLVVLVMAVLVMSVLVMAMLVMAVLVMAVLVMAVLMLVCLVAGWQLPGCHGWVEGWVSAGVAAPHRHWHHSSCLGARGGWEDG